MGQHLKPCAFILTTFPRTVKELQTRAFDSLPVTRYERPSSRLVRPEPWFSQGLSLRLGFPLPLLQDGRRADLCCFSFPRVIDSGGMRRAQKGSENRSKPVSLPFLGVDTSNSVAQENSLFLLKMTQFTGQAEMKPTRRNKSVHYLKVPR